VLPPAPSALRATIVATQRLHALYAAAVTSATKVRQAARCAQQVPNRRLEHQPARLVMQEATAVVVRVQCLVACHAPPESTKVVQA